MDVMICSRREQRCTVSKRKFTDFTRELWWPEAKKKNSSSLISQKRLAKHRYGRRFLNETHEQYWPLYRWFSIAPYERNTSWSKYFFMLDSKLVIIEGTVLKNCTRVAANIAKKRWFTASKIVKRGATRDRHPRKLHSWRFRQPRL